MKKFVLNKKFFFCIVIISLVVYFAIKKERVSQSEYIPIKVLATNLYGQNFIGNATCAECHKEIVKTHLETAHFKTSSFSNKNNIKGNFNKGFNHFKLNEDITFKMVSNENGQFQEAYNSNGYNRIYSLKFDINMGSGTKGQSYLTWINEGLYQQQISYYTPSNNWINSPMYPMGKLVQPRPILGECIGCHATYATKLSVEPEDNRYNRNQIVLGIDCEKCHGPAERHVLLARNNPKIPVGNSIVSFSSLNRQQRLDACAICHSGLSEKNQGGVLNYRVGEVLHYDSNEIATNKNLDVHGNQYGLLIQSKCFKKSDKMDCITCHNVHKNERGQSRQFNQKCMSCHTKENVQHKNNFKKFSDLDCINCHMPVRSSKNLLINNNQLDTLTPLQVRTHLIKVY